jgi:enhancer of mRNA-decapping protein 3
MSTLKAVFAEFEEAGDDGVSHNLSGTTATLIQQNQARKPEEKYRFDQNVLETTETALPTFSGGGGGGGVSGGGGEDGGAEVFRTETLVPTRSITWEDQRHLHSVASDMGLQRVQTVEVSGVCLAQMVVGILGGSRRINPKNAQQAPEVLVLIGDSECSSEAICAARHLLNHHVKPVLYLPTALLPTLTQEGFGQYKLFVNCGGVVVEGAAGLPQTPVDLIVDSIGPAGPQAGEQLVASSAAAVKWCASSKASVLSLEHPGGVDPDGGAHVGPSIKAARCVAFGLPKIGDGFAGACSQLLLADNGIPAGAYEELGIEYHNPFHDKFVLPLERA